MAKAAKRTNKTTSATKPVVEPADSPSTQVSKIQAPLPAEPSLSQATTAPELPTSTTDTVAEPAADATVADELLVEVAPDTVATEPMPVPRRLKPLVRRALLAGLIIMVIASAGLIVWRRHHSTQMSSADIQALVAVVGRRAVLPSGETPTVSTVVDTSKVNQPFLANAQDGDKVLLYFQAGKAIVYRPSTGQIVNMGPLTSPAATVFLRNGGSGSIPTSLSSSLTSTNGFQVVSQDKSSNSYGQTLVIDVKGNRPDLAAKAVQLVGGKVSSLPSNETPPDADILIIVGNDKE